MQVNNNIEIRKITSIPELLQVQQLDELVWKNAAIPLHQTLTAVQNGGLVIGAFDQGQLVGFSYSFPGFENGKVYLCSHMLGIHPDYRKQGIGLLLKQKQKNEALKIGYTLLTWTYDPLESVNAYLNLSKLRAVTNTYIENCYGEMSDGLNDGLPTDRLKVHWYIDDSYIAETNSWDEKLLPVITGWSVNEAGFPILNDKYESNLFATEETVLLPVPNNFQQMKKNQLQLAIDWRYRTRQIFQHAFQLGFVAVHIIKNEQGPVHYYVLTKKITN